MPGGTTSLLSLSHNSPPLHSLPRQGLLSPPTCRHWTAIAAPKHSRPHKRRLNTPQWCRAHQRKTSPHQRKKLQQYPHRLASPRAPPMSVLDLASQQLGAWTPSRLFSPSSQGFTHTNCLALVHLLLLLLRARCFHPSFQTFLLLHTKPFSLISPVSALRAAEDSGPCRAGCLASQPAGLCRF